MPCCTVSRIKNTLLAFIVCGGPVTRAHSVSCFLACSQHICFVGWLSSGQQRWASIRERTAERNTDYTKQSDSARFHWTWCGARARHAVECLCGGWHFNDLISLGRIFLWVVSSITGSIKWSCCIMMNPLYLPTSPECMCWDFSPRPYG